jgi:hypothetical protein
VRYLLLIPALFLFFSNVPFVQQMRMEEMKKTSTTKGCCEKNGSVEGVCHKAADAQHQGQQKGNCEKSESTCICIFCFQYSAPEQTIIKFDSKDFSSSSDYNFPREQHWLDPYISAPWQPPDFASLHITTA